MNKTYRHEQIRNLIRQRQVRTQDDLSLALKALGLRVTQVTLSRDIREMGLVKGSRGYQENSLGGDLSVEEVSPFRRTVAEYVRDVQTAQNLVIVLTMRGTAAPVADAIDQERWPEIVGTVAGEDTIFVAAKDSKKALEVRERLLSLLR